MTYSERPPASARSARMAWDYFTAKKSNARRMEVYYSPRCDGIRQWVADLEVLPNDLMHWGTSYSDDWRTLMATPYEIRRWHRTRSE
jgi:hypothetical protein